MSRQQVNHTRCDQKNSSEKSDRINDAVCIPVDRAAVKACLTASPFTLSQACINGSLPLNLILHSTWVGNEREDCSKCRWLMHACRCAVYIANYRTTVQLSVV